MQKNSGRTGKLLEKDKANVERLTGNGGLCFPIGGPGFPIGGLFLLKGTPFLQETAILIIRDPVSRIWGGAVFRKGNPVSLQEEENDDKWVQSNRGGYHIQQEASYVFLQDSGKQLSNQRKQTKFFFYCFNLFINKSVPDSQTLFQSQ